MVSASDAFDGFFRAHFDKLVGSLSLYCGDRFLGEEAAQEAMVKAFAGGMHSKDLASPDAWLFVVGRNILTSYFRRRRLLRRVEDIMKASAAPTSSQPHYSWLRQFVDGLPERQRTVNILRFYLDLSVAQSADAVGWPENTIKTLTRRGLENPRKTLGDGGRNDERE